MRIKPASLIFLLVLIFPVIAASNSLAATRTVEDVEAGIQALELAKRSIQKKQTELFGAVRDSKTHVMLIASRITIVRDEDIMAFTKAAQTVMALNPELASVVANAYPDVGAALAGIDKLPDKWELESEALSAVVDKISAKLEEFERGQMSAIRAITGDYLTLLDEINSAIKTETERRDAILAGYSADSVAAVESRTCSPEDWSGAWDTNWTLVNLDRAGSDVSGDYSYKNGRLSGRLRDNGCRLTGTWTQEPSRSYPRDKGAFDFILSSDGRSFAGAWGFGDDGNLNGGLWTGSKVP